MNLSDYKSVIEKAATYKHYGKVLRVVGLMIESEGPAANIGEVCYIHSSSSNRPPIVSEVVGFNNEKILLMPYAEVTEIGSGCLVESTGKLYKERHSNSLFTSRRLFQVHLFSLAS